MVTKVKVILIFHLSQREIRLDAAKHRSICRYRIINRPLPFAIIYKKDPIHEEDSYSSILSGQ
jgi:hypothetical protein